MKCYAVPEGCIQVLRDFLADGRMRHRQDCGDELVRVGYSETHTHHNASHILSILKDEGFVEQVLIRGKAKGYWRRIRQQAIAA